MTYDNADMWWLGLALFLVCIIEVSGRFISAIRFLTHTYSVAVLTMSTIMAGSTYSL